MSARKAPPRECIYCPAPARKKHSMCETHAREHDKELDQLAAKARVGGY